MSDEKALPPGEDQGKADETLEIKSPVQPQANQGALQPSADETQSTVLQDPTRRRDTNTASLKRLRPEDFNVSSDGAADEADQTETVNIKVIKEQKKQFRNMMTSSQTLAVDSDGAPQEGPAAAPAATQDASKATLKIKAPSQETRTESIPRPGAQDVAPATQAPASPKSTLKIKAPAGMSPAQASGTSKPGATLKIKAPAAAPAAQPDAAAQTVQQAAPSRPGKTLKLKPGQAAAPAAKPQRRQGAASQYSKTPQPVDVSASPGIAYTICSVAGVAACVVALVKICTSINELFNTVNVFDSKFF